MTIIYVLVPLSILLLALAVAAFIWAVNNDQFDDLDTPALDILDDDEHASAGRQDQKAMNRKGAKDAKNELETD